MNEFDVEKCIVKKGNDLLIKIEEKHKTEIKQISEDFLNSLSFTSSNSLDILKENINKDIIIDKNDSLIINNYSLNMIKLIEENSNLLMQNKYVNTMVSDNLLLKSFKFKSPLTMFPDSEENIIIKRKVEKYVGICNKENFLNKLLLMKDHLNESLKNNTQNETTIAEIKKRKNTFRINLYKAFSIEKNSDHTKDPDETNSESSINQELLGSTLQQTQIENNNLKEIKHKNQLLIFISVFKYVFTKKYSLLSIFISDFNNKSKSMIISLIIFKLFISFALCGLFLHVTQ